MTSDGDWTRAVAAVVDGRGLVRGTAFFVGPDVALTCMHVTSAAGQGNLSLKPVQSGLVEPVIDLDLDPPSDLALCACLWKQAGDGSS